MLNLQLERQRIENITKEEKHILEDYKNKIRSVKNEKHEFEKEIDKIKGILENPPL